MFGLDRLYWNVYTRGPYESFRGGKAHVGEPRHNRPDSNVAATCCENPTPEQVRRSGLSYRVVYRPEHPANRDRVRRLRASQAILDGSIVRKHLL